MSRRRPSGRATCPPVARKLRLVFPLALIVLAAGCDSASQPNAGGSTAAAKVISCGQGKTAADVPVSIEIAHGQSTCATALAIMKAYANAIRQGLAPGNGGGGPVNIQGWTCQGFDTPYVLKTGDASKCDQDGTEILAVLPTPS